MDGEDATTLTRPDEDDEEELGTRFWLRLAGLVAAIGILLTIALLIFWRALYAWGFLGAVLGLAVILVLYGWIYDRRHPR
jgi:hypothetical protein